MLHDLRRPAYGLVAVTVWLALLPGCRTPPAGHDPRGSGIPPGVRAPVTTGTADRESYTGMGEFGVNDADGVNQPKTFSMNSRSQEGPAGAASTFGDTRARTEHPQPLAPTLLSFPITGKHAGQRWPQPTTPRWTVVWKPTSGRVVPSPSRSPRPSGSPESSASRRYATIVVPCAAPAGS
jgi:hypothetical protein